jgi:hypothetical protein
MVSLLPSQQAQAKRGCLTVCRKTPGNKLTEARPRCWEKSYLENHPSSAAFNSQLDLPMEVPELSDANFRSNLLSDGNLGLCGGPPDLSSCICQAAWATLRCLTVRTSLLVLPLRRLWSDEILQCLKRSLGEVLVLHEKLLALHVPPPHLWACWANAGGSERATFSASFLTVANTSPSMPETSGSRSQQEGEAAPQPGRWSHC